MTRRPGLEGWMVYNVGDVVRCPGHRRPRFADRDLPCSAYHGRVSKGTVVLVRLFQPWRPPAPGIVQVCHSCKWRYEVLTLVTEKREDVERWVEGQAA